jgi:hypothetical protein
MKGETPMIQLHHHDDSNPHGRYHQRGNRKRSYRSRFFSFLLTSDKLLLYIFLISVGIVSLSIILVPWSDLEYNTDPGGSSNIANQLYKPQQNKNGNDLAGKNVHDRHQLVKKLSTTTDLGDTSYRNSNYFHEHPSRYHTIFSSGCSTFQDWQSYVFFYHVMRSGQEGHITRIASGCESEDIIDITKVFEKEIESMAPGRMHLHLTPDYSSIPKKNPEAFKYFNKPLGVRHWMEHALGYPQNHELHDDSIVILLDPDQIMMRPFTNDFTGSSEIWRLT